jgi:hypothetical protein
MMNLRLGLALCTIGLICTPASAQSPVNPASAASAKAPSVSSTPAQLPKVINTVEANPFEQHPWQVPGPRLTAEAYFANLADDAKIETPYVLRFGLSGGWGLATARPGITIC